MDNTYVITVFVIISAKGVHINSHTEEIQMFQVWLSL